MAVKRFNEEEIRKTIAALKPDGELFELRIIGTKWNASGYFMDADTLIKELNAFYFKTDANIYILPHEIQEACGAREQRNKLVVNPKATTSDKEIIGYNLLLIDLDAERVSGTSSTNEQLEAAKQKANRIYAFMRDNGFYKPIVAVSGNGVHLLYRVTLANRTENVELVKRFLGAMDMMFSDDVIKIDTAVFNPARIIKLYGTMAQKGANIESAPHRMAQIVTLPDNYYDDVNDKVLVEKIANMLPKEEKPQRYNNYKPSAFDVRAWLDEHRIEYTSSAFTGGTKYVLRECPFDSNHKGKDAAIFQMDSGAIAFKCFHNSCADKTWRDVRLKYEPHAYDYSAHPATPNSQRPNYKPPKIKEEEAPDIPSWLTTSYINNLKQQTHEFIPTGIKGIDRVMRGFQKGSVTCLSGLRAAGKSSLISELILNAAQQGYKSALFSGELTAQKALNWIMLQAAGKNFVQPTEYDNFYVVEPPIKEKIASWLNDKLFIFNNQKGNKYDYILQAIEDCVQKKKIDLVILDNLMALDITMLSGDKYERQSQFIKMLTQYAKRADIAIIFVAHPRKAMGFLRLEDVSGNADLTNAADSVFIIHRVNNDFRRLSKEMFKWKDDNDCYLADNVIEICKDRESGNQDVFVPLYYERASKRLKNSRDEHIVYNWQEAIEKNEKTDKSLWDDFEDIEIIEGDDDLPWN